MVFPSNPNSGGFTSYGDDAMRGIRASGADTYVYYNTEKTKIFVLIRYSMDKLQCFAELINFKMLLDPAVLKDTLEAGDQEAGIEPVFIGHERGEKFGPYEYIYARYVSGGNDSLYWRPFDEVPNQSFTESVRLKVINQLLDSHTSLGGAGLKVRRLLLDKKALAYYPMPNLALKQILRDEWLKTFMTPNGQPFGKIRSYFGDKVALIFEFRGHLVTWLLVPAFIGLVFEAVIVGTFNFSHPVIPFFSLVIAVWSVLMTEYWKRREFAVAMKTGMSDMEESQRNRPEFKGTERPSLIDGTPEITYPKRKGRMRVGASFSVIAVFVLIVIGVVAGIYTMRFVLYQSIGSNAQVVASVVNVVQIQVLTFLFDFLAFKLTDLENNRTDVIYEDSMIVKLFLFQFVNNYASFYYIAFVARNLPVPPGAPEGSVGECGYEDCMTALAVNLGIIFGARIFIKNTFMLILNRFLKRRNLRLAQKTNGSKPLSPAEQEEVKQPYDIMRMQLQEYADISTFFGYTVYFTSALPAGPFFSLVNTYLDIRFHAYSALVQYRRPILTGVQDIGTWQTMFEISSTIGVITNAGLIVFTMNTLDIKGYTSIGKLWIFIGFQYVLFLSQKLIRTLVADKPTYVSLQGKRTEFIVSKVIDKVRDADDENVLNAKQLKIVQEEVVYNDSAPGM
jgi:hypothetical protein